MSNRHRNHNRHTPYQKDAGWTVDIRTAATIIGVVVGVAFNVGAVLWGAATYAEKLSNLAAQVGKLEQKIETIGAERDRLTKVEAQLQILMAQFGPRGAIDPVSAGARAR